jgi:hypothetical protein
MYLGCRGVLVTFVLKLVPFFECFSWSCGGLCFVVPLRGDGRARARARDSRNASGLLQLLEELGSCALCSTVLQVEDWR